MKSDPVCGGYLNLSSCLAQDSVCQTSNEDIRDDCNVTITMTPFGSKFLLRWASTEIRHRLYVLSLILFEQNKHFANGGQLLRKYPVIAPVKSKTCYKRHLKEQQTTNIIKPKKKTSKRNEK